MNHQESAWAGEWGDEYTRRNTPNLHSNVIFFGKALQNKATQNVTSVLELGAGAGANMQALGFIYPNACLTGIEINPATTEILKAHTNWAICGSVTNIDLARTYDLVLTKGFLIHVHPDLIGMVYDTIYKHAARFILVAEYYNPTPVMVEYRGQKDLLWKRDFAGEMLDRFSDLKLIDYGFVYHRDENPQDDLSWFLMEVKT